MLVVVKFVLLGAIGPPLLDPLLVVDGAHELLIPLNDGGPILEPCVEVEEGVAVSTIKIHAGGEDLSQGTIISRLGIEQQTEDRELVERSLSTQ